MPKKPADKQPDPNEMVDLENYNTAIAVEKMMLRGITNQRMMAARLGLCQQTISYHCQNITRRWQEEQKEKLPVRRGRRIRQLESIAQQAFNGYDLSRRGSDEQQDLYKPCYKCIDGEDDQGQPCSQCGGTGKVAQVTVKVSGRPAGDPAFLKLAADCLRECAKLEGAYPEKRVKADVHVTGKIQHYATLAADTEDMPEAVVIEAVQALRRLEDYRAGRVLEGEVVDAAEPVADTSSS